MRNSFKSFWKRILLFFTGIHYPTLFKSFWEVGLLTLLALIPLLTNIVLSASVTDNFLDSAKAKILPIELLSFCLSFVAPSIYLLVRAQERSYKLPFIHLFLGLTLLLYTISFLLYMVTKNKWISEINGESNELNYYFKIVVIFLIIIILIRIYTVYHSRYMGSIPRIRDQQQEDFNSDFKERLK